MEKVDSNVGSVTLEKVKCAHCGKEIEEEYPTICGFCRYKMCPSCDEGNCPHK